MTTRIKVLIGICLGVTIITYAQMPKLSDQIQQLWSQKKIAELQALADSRLQADSNDVMGVAISLDLYPVIGTNTANLVSLKSRMDTYAASTTNQAFLGWYNFFTKLHSETISEFTSTDTNRQAAIRTDIQSAVGPPPSFLLAQRLGL